MSIRVVTDSTSDLPPELAAERGVTVLPLTVLWAGEQLRDGVDITPDRFFRRLQRESTLPTTSQPSPGAFLETYERLRDEGATGIVSVHISRRLSGTVESAEQAAREVRGVEVAVVDSQQVSMGFGLAALVAAEAAAGGAPLAEVRARTVAALGRTRLVAMIDTLEYLRRGGRIGRGMEMMGNLLRVKPLVTMEEGELLQVGRVRTRPRALEALVQHAADLRPLERAAVVHATTPQDAVYLAERLHGLDPALPIVPGRIGPVVGTHAGPGIIGFAAITRPAAP